MKGRNLSSYDGCSCHLNPPCSFCENTFTCDECGDIYDNDEMVECDKGFLCQSCFDDYKPY